MFLRPPEGVSGEVIRMSNVIAFISYSGSKILRFHLDNKTTFDWSYKDVDGINMLDEENRVTDYIEEYERKSTIKL